MVSRRTALALAEVYKNSFRSPRRYPGGRLRYYVVDSNDLYDFLFRHNYEAWFCNQAQEDTNFSDTRLLKEFVMRIHTGETLQEATPSWTREKREQLGQRYLQDLAKDFLDDWNDGLFEQDEELADSVKRLLRSLELDGYVYRDSRLWAPEGDVLDSEEEARVLESLYTSLGLSNEQTVLHSLTLSEEHYIAGRWDDSIANSRKFLECVMREVAAAHSLRYKEGPLSRRKYDRASEVREYLEREGVLETKEKKAIASIYGLLSDTGSHPYIAQNDQARLLRQLALILSQFVMLRFQGRLNKDSGDS